MTSLFIYGLLSLVIGQYWVEHENSECGTGDSNRETKQDLHLYFPNVVYTWENCQAICEQDPECGCVHGDLKSEGTVNSMQKDYDCTGGISYWDNNMSYLTCLTFCAVSAAEWDTPGCCTLKKYVGWPEVSTRCFFFLVDASVREFEVSENANVWYISETWAGTVTLGKQRSCFTYSCTGDECNPSPASTYDAHVLILPTEDPTADPTPLPSINPTGYPTEPTPYPTGYPTTEPTRSPTSIPTSRSSADPTIAPTILPTAQPTWSQTDSYLNAVKSCRMDKVTTFLVAGISLDVRDENNDTALILAAEQDCTSIVELLLELGAEVNIKGSIGRTAITRAVIAGNCETVVLLLKWNADPAIEDTSRKDSYWYAVFDKKVQVCLTSETGWPTRTPTQIHETGKLYKEEWVWACISVLGVMIILVLAYALHNRY